MERPYIFKNFLSPPCFRDISENVDPLSPYTMLNQQAGPLSIWKNITYPNRASHLPFKQHCFPGEGFCSSPIAQITGIVQRFLADVVVFYVPFRRCMSTLTLSPCFVEIIFVSRITLYDLLLVLLVILHDSCK